LVGGTDTNGLWYIWDFQNDGVIDSEGTQLETAQWCYTQGVYSVALQVVNDSGDTAAATRVDYIHVRSSSNLYASLSGAHVPPFGSWLNAATDLPAAVEYAWSGDQVLVNTGTYALAESVQVGNGAAVRSVGGLGTVVLDGQQAVRCLDVSDGRVEGLVISNGLMRGTQPGQCGGGVYCAGGLLRNCEIVQNEADYGGGLGLASSGIVENCVIRRNWATGSGGRGGGVYCAGGGTLRNSLLILNEAQQRGGGCYLDDGGALENVTVTLNEAPDASGLACNGRGAVRNSIISGNGTSEYAISGVGAVLDRNCSTPLMAGLGNIAVDPQFVDLQTGDARLAGNSPCVDAAAVLPWMAGAADLDGKARVFISIPDMGAYELHSMPALAAEQQVKQNKKKTKTLFKMKGVVPVLDAYLRDGWTVGLLDEEGAILDGPRALSGNVRQTTWKHKTPKTAKLRYSTKKSILKYKVWADVPEDASVHLVPAGVQGH
jgi:hypothetical protein